LVIDPQNRVGSILVERVTVGDEDLPRQLLSILAAPALRVADDEAAIVSCLGARQLCA
jgi:hypothetical protein